MSFLPFANASTLVGAIIAGAAANEIFYADSNRKLAQSSGLTYDGTNLSVGTVPGTAGTITTNGSGNIVLTPGSGGTTTILGSGSQTFTGSTSGTTTFAAAATAAGAYTYPVSAPAGNGYLLSSTTAGVMSWKPIGSSFSAYAAGTVYSLTNAQAAIDFGTTDPAITITATGTYLIMGTAQLEYNAATFAANQTATLKFRRTNNTAADLTNASRTVELRILTSITDNAGSVVIPPTIYTTSNTNDAIAMYGALSAAPGAGSVDVMSAEIIAILLF